MEGEEFIRTCISSSSSNSSTCNSWCKQRLQREKEKNGASSSRKQFTFLVPTLNIISTAENCLKCFRNCSNNFCQKSCYSGINGSLDDDNNWMVDSCYSCRENNENYYCNGRKGKSGNNRRCNGPLLHCPDDNNNRSSSTKGIKSGTPSFRVGAFGPLLISAVVIFLLVFFMPGSTHANPIGGMTKNFDAEINNNNNNSATQEQEDDLYQVRVQGVYHTQVPNSRSLRQLSRSHNCFLRDEEKIETVKGNGGENRNVAILNKILKCNATNDLIESFNQFLDGTNVDSMLIDSVEIAHSSFDTLNLSEFSIFENVKSISVTQCNVSKVIGPTPPSLKSLNLSSNSLKSIDSSAFTFDNNTQEPLPHLSTIDLTHNHISEFPKNVFNLKRLTSLKLFDNHFKCDFFLHKMAEWYKDFDKPTSVLVDSDDTVCKALNDNVRTFQYTILGVLKARKSLDETCGRVNESQCSGCALFALQREPAPGYPIIHRSRNGSVISISLTLDCSSKNLTHLPDVPIQTWELNVSNNRIKDLTPLNTNRNYSSLVMLHAENNQINVTTLQDSPFLNTFAILDLRNNSISHLPSNLLSSIKEIDGQGQMTLGDNYIECDCDTVKEVRPILIMLSTKKRVKDIDYIFCKGLKSPDGNHPLLIRDLQYADVCKTEENGSNEFWVYVVIAMEVVLIMGIVAKVWHDQRIFRQTGVLPWCSAKMPRLPCDAMLERIKDPPNYNYNGHQQLQSAQREMRSGSNCTTKSGKSSRSSSAQSSSV